MSRNFNPSDSGYNEVASRIVEFREKTVENGDGCWEWTGKRGANGYGVIWHQGREYYAHRVFYTALAGPVPAGLDLDHLCRVRHCVNPSHLEAVTRGENVLRGQSPVAQNAKKTHCPKGHSLADAYISRGARECRTCKKTRSAAARARKKAIAR